MIALPLSVGIAVASGAPPTAGIIAAVLGGMIGSLMSGNRLAINGPAAGLIVIVFAAINELGQGDPTLGFKAMLGCVAIAGLIQIILGILRLGTLGMMFPVTVVHGMLTAIGLIIMAKQFHTGLGISGVQGTPLEQWMQIPNSIAHMNPVIAMIGVTSLTVMVIWPILGKGITNKVPAPLAAILFGSALGLYFDLEHQHLIEGQFGAFTVGPEFLLNVPASLKSAINFPDFSLIGTVLFWKHTVMIALVATAESILSTCAINKLDPEKRRSNLNRDLLGKGVVNVLCGFLGGLPVITEIVRSSANVANGAKSQASNFLHGFFLLMFLLMMPNLLHQIPLASLAAVLLLVGMRLGSPKHFWQAFRHGRAQGAVFVLTVVTILATDLLAGVLVGTLAEFVILASSSRTWKLFKLQVEKRGEPEDPVVAINGPIGFTNYIALRSHLDPSMNARRLTLDLRRSRVIDQTVREHLDSHIADFAAQGKELRIKHISRTKEQENRNAH